ncbi:MAG: S8 family peptidase [Parvibaculum sp.]
MALLKPIAAFICAASMAAATGASAATNLEYSAHRQRNLTQIGVTEELHGTVNGTGVGIAIFDGEIDSSHIDLQGKTTTSRPYSGTYFFGPDGHGTHVAGIAGGAGNNIGIIGVAPGSRLYGYAVFDDFRWVANDLGRMALNNVRARNYFGANIAVVNMSYGAEQVVFGPGELEILDDYRDDFVIVRAAGNDGERLQGITYAGGLASETLSHLLIVGSVRGNNKPSVFSNRAGVECFDTGRKCRRDERIKSFFIVAPGDNIMSDYPANRLALASGTSMAAPHVAGAVALVAQDGLNNNVDLTPSQIVSIIKLSATDLGHPGVDPTFGWGLLNVPAALAPIGPTSIATSAMVPTSDDGGSSTGSRLLFGSWQNSAMRVSASSLLSGLVVFDSFGRPFEVNAAALTASSSRPLTERGLNVLGLVSQQKTVDFDSGETAVLAWNAAGVDGEVTSAMHMVSGNSDLNIGIGSPQLFLSAIPSSNRAGEPQRFSQIMFSSLGEASELFDEAISVGFGTKLTDRLSGNVFAMTESTIDIRSSAPALTDPTAKAESEADFAAIGLSYRIMEDWSAGGSYAVLRERGSVLGAVSEGAFSLGEEAVTQFQGVNLTGKLDDMWSLAAFYTRATINSSGVQGSLFDPADDWGGDHYGLMLDARNALQANSLLRFSLTKPLQITSGTMSLRVPVSREFDGTVNYERREGSFDSDAMPLEAGISYLAETGHGTAGLSFNLVDTNVNGAGESGVSVGAGFAFRF